MNRICNTCNIKIDETICLKVRTIRKNCYNKSRRKNNNNTVTQNQQPKIDKTNNTNVKNPNVSTYENHAYVVIGPRNVHKTYYMLKILEKIVNQRPIIEITRSPNQIPKFKTSNEIKPINKCRGSVVNFGDVIGARNSSQKIGLFKRGKHEDLDVHYISQSYFALPRQSMGDNSDRLILFRKTFRDVQSMYYDLGAYDMKNDDFQEMCEEAWSERFNFFSYMTKK